MRAIKYSLLFLMLGSSVACQAGSDKTCPFKYDEQVLHELVVPAVNLKFSGKGSLFYRIYNYKDPVVRRRDNNMIEITYDQDKPKGRIPIDAPFLVVVVDPCAHKVVDLFETDAWLRRPAK